MSPKESRVKPTLVGPDFFVGTPSAVGSDLFGKLREAKKMTYFLFGEIMRPIWTLKVSFFCKMKTWKLLMATWHFADVG